MKVEVAENAVEGDGEAAEGEGGAEEEKKEEAPEDQLEN